MAKCLIHIGWHKTGSTSLQRFLKINAHSLQKVGWFSPTDEPFRYMYPAISSKTDNKYYYGEYFSPPHSRFTSESRKKDSLLKFENALKQSKGKNLVISAEDLCLLSSDEINRLKEILSSHFKKVSILCYIRTHSNYTRSAIQQLIKMGFPYASIQNKILGKFDDHSIIKAINPLPNYGKKIAMWIECFGKSNVYVESFDKYKSDPIQIYRSFISYIEPKILFNTLEIPTNQNESVSLKTLSILNRLSDHNRLIISGKPSPMFILNIGRYLKYINNDKLEKLPMLIFDSISKAFESDSENLLSLGFNSVANELKAPRVEEFSNLDTIFNEKICLDEDILSSLFQISVESQNRSARAKFFSALLQIEKNGVQPSYISQLNDALFLMTDPKIIESSAIWLSNNNRPYEAKRFIRKASLIRQINQPYLDNL